MALQGSGFDTGEEICVYTYILYICMYSYMYIYIYIYISLSSLNLVILYMETEAVGFRSGLSDLDSRSGTPGEVCPESVEERPSQACWDVGLRVKWDSETLGLRPT